MATRAAAARALALFAVVFAALALTSRVGASEPQLPYRPAARVAHLRDAIAALRDAPPAALRQQIELVRGLAHGACSAGAERLRIECMIVAARRYCREREGDAARCALTMDVVVGNALADERLVPPETRYRIVRENVDYRPALARELHRVQGALAVDFRLRTGEANDPATLASKIDAYCLAAADETNMAYPTCVASLSWFIGGPQ